MAEIVGDDRAAQPWSDAPALVVGIGASAGGIAALQHFFRHVGPDTGAAYVVILHLSPEYESHLAEVLQTTASMPVVQVRERMPLRRNHVYVIPQDKRLEVQDGQLNLLPIAGPEHRQAPVDRFFRTLAEAQGARAVCVVLSGTGANGSSGLKRVKEHGGLTIAQDPEEAEYGDMPRNAIATGLADFILRIREMPAKIVDYMHRSPPGPAVVAAVPGDDGAVREILALLRVRTGQDFSNYKAGTLLRRIERRLGIRGVPGMKEYAALMREETGEAAALMKELLISVTSFFRDPKAFDMLERLVIPRLIEYRTAADHVRVWVAGCATGEEAYSVAMLLAETAAAAVDPPALQVFATDLDEHALAVAREALYSKTDVSDVPEERLQRFFLREAGGYRVRRELREIVLFAHHNVIKDPPFSHLDLIACRNLLIYLNRSIQERLVETFHVALRPGGYLFLGTSESPDGDDLFAIVDKEAHISQSRVVANRPLRPLAGLTPLTLVRDTRPALAPPPERLSPADLHQRLLEQYAPPSIVVTEEHSVVHVSERAGRYLQVPGGEPSRDVMRLIRPELRLDLRAALHQAAKARAAVHVRAGRVDGPDGPPIIISVRPALREGDPTRGFLLILFEEERQAAPGAGTAMQSTAPPDPMARQPDEELTRVKAQLRATIEQYETQVEEAKASNEELQAMNEELRSSAEELETSREELQSVNEELSTVNQELKVTIDELGSANNDFQNLINSTEIGTMFLDRSLRVKLATPQVNELFHLLPSDRGRPLSDLTSKVKYDRLQEDLRQVLERLQTIEREVETTDGRVFLLRLLPYRTTDDRIDGVVLTFQDVSGRHEADQRVRASEARLRAIVDQTIDYAIFGLEANGTIDSWNAGAERVFGYAAPEVVGRHFGLLFTEQDRGDGAPDRELQQARDSGRCGDERWHIRKDGSRVFCSGVTTRVGSDATKGFMKIARNLTAQQEAEQALQQEYGRLDDRVRERTAALQAEVVQHAGAREHVVNLLQKIVTAQEDERKRIARDLHDRLGQQLTALRLALERQRDRPNAGAPDDDELTRALDLAHHIDSEIDFLAWELRPAVLDDLGLAEALPRYVYEWSAHYGVAAECRTSGVTRGLLSPQTEVALYRIAQEALTNVFRHAHASRADVILEARDAQVVLVVEDDGIGFEPAGNTADAGVGLAGMRERASLIGAALQIESAPGRGTTVLVRAPVRGTR